jgi:hypothetical protein
MMPRSDLPVAAGIGLRSPHLARVQAELPPVAWFEVHSENYFADGGPALFALDRIRVHYPLSLHGVGLSLGSTDPLARAHLDKLATLIARLEPALVSEHLCWSGWRAALQRSPAAAFTHEAMRPRLRAHRRSAGLSRREIAVENVSSYVAFDDSTMPEWEFVAEVGSADRLQAAARRQQRLRQRREPRVRCRRVSRGDAGGRRRGDSSCRIRKRRPMPHRYPRRARRAGSLGAVQRNDRADRTRGRR